jgi:hypothetical protein
MMPAHCPRWRHSGAGGIRTSLALYTDGAANGAVALTGAALQSLAKTYLLSASVPSKPAISARV